MKREIKYRGKDLENENSWRYGSLIVYPNGNYVIVEFDKDGNELSYDVDSETVGQFTGLYDKDGKEIYEGDYLKGLGDEIYAVWYSKELACYMVDLVVPDSQATDSLGCYDIEKYFEVIGNIHDNPELIKEK